MKTKFFVSKEFSTELSGTIEANTAQEALAKFDDTSDELLREEYLGLVAGSEKVFELAPDNSTMQ